MKQTAPLPSISPVQFFFQVIQNLTIDSVLGDLPSYKTHVDSQTTGSRIASLLEQDSHLPGVIIMDAGNIRGMVSREMFYERTGKLFGTEIYLGRPISSMLEILEQDYLLLPADLLITLATERVLNRDLRRTYDPIIVEHPDNNYHLLSPLMLFIAQSHQLLDLHRQRAYTIDAGHPLSDREAIIKFIKHVGNRPEFKLNLFLQRQAIRCDQCQEMVNFSIIDIVRSFPQLNRGVIVEEKMGSCSYRVYVRHRCKQGEIWEIPLLLDEKLQYRSQRLARAVESYV